MLTAAEILGVTALASSKLSGERPILCDLICSSERSLPIQDEFLHQVESLQLSISYLKRYEVVADDSFLG